MIVVNQSRALSPRFAFQFLDAVMSLPAILRDAYARRETRNVLSTLSDSALADIGLTRAMVEKL